MKRSTDPFAHPLSRLALEVFRLNGALIAAGDGLVAPLGLTSARWQVMGAVAQSPEPLPTVQLARNMGLTRQSVQRVVDDLAAQGLVAFAANPHHKRAKLVQLTEEGKDVFARALALWTPLADDLLASAGERAVAEAIVLIERLRARLGADGNHPDPGSTP